jgi:hypothetical protein
MFNNLTGQAAADYYNQIQAHYHQAGGNFGSQRALQKLEMQAYINSVSQPTPTEPNDLLLLLLED